jgi:hypothetical protein
VLLISCLLVCVGCVTCERRETDTRRNRVVKASYDSWIKSTIWSGRPLRALRNPYVADWELNRQAEIKELTGKGVVPLVYEIDRLHRAGTLTDEIEDAVALRYVYEGDEDGNAADAE